MQTVSFCDFLLVNFIAPRNLSHMVIICNSSMSKVFTSNFITKPANKCHIGILNQCKDVPHEILVTPNSSCDNCCHMNFLVLQTTCQLQKIVPPHAFKIKLRKFKLTLLLEEAPRKIFTTPREIPCLLYFVFYSKEILEFKKSAES